MNVRVMRLHALLSLQAEQPLCTSECPGGAGTGGCASTGTSLGDSSGSLRGADPDTPTLSYDPVPFECPYSACEYDCQKRAPVRVPCPCGRLVCRKCAGVAGAQPAGCGLCGAAGVEFGHSECLLDAGVVLALAANMPAGVARCVQACK
jgi:hypothetical protein